MIPLGDLGVELLLGLGVALFGANAVVLVRGVLERRRIVKAAPRPPARGRVWLNLVIGAVVATWALATLLARG